MTMVFFTDLVVRSPTGAFVLEARSPDNGRPGFGQFGFQRDFAYRLVRADRTVVWTADQRQAPPPIKAWISDDGWSIVETFGGTSAGLFVIEPAGTRVLHVHIRNKPDGGFSADAPRGAEWVDGHCLMTTAGMAWSHNALGCFFRADGRQWFSLRTSWGRRLAIELEDRHAAPSAWRTARLAGDDEIEAPAWRREASAAERARVCDVLERRDPDLLGAALAIAGDDRLDHLLPLVMWLGEIHADSRADAGWHRRPDASPGDLTRSRTQLQVWWAIRQLGATPPGPSEPDASPGRPAARARTASGPPLFRARDVPSFGNVVQAVDRLGFPHYVRSGSARNGGGSGRGSWWTDWEYDMAEDGDAWTVRVRWSPRGLGRAAEVVDVREVEPGWRDVRRRQELFWTLS